MSYQKDWFVFNVHKVKPFIQCSVFHPVSLREHLPNKTKQKMLTNLILRGAIIKCSVSIVAPRTVGNHWQNWMQCKFRFKSCSYELKLLYLSVDNSFWVKLTTLTKVDYNEDLKTFNGVFWMAICISTHKKSDLSQSKTSVTILKFCFLFTTSKVVSSLHWIIFLSFCSFSYNRVYFNWSRLSVSDVIVSQKGFNGDKKLHFFAPNECALRYWASMGLKMNQRKYTPLYKKDINKIKISQWRLLILLQ